MLPNLLQYPIAMFGALRAGLVVVNTNPLYTATELEHQLKDSGASAIVVLENFAATLEQALPDTQRAARDRHRRRRPAALAQGAAGQLGAAPRAAEGAALAHPEARSFRDVLRAGRTLPLLPVTLDHKDLAYLQYTGGTTGVAKGAMLTHGNMVANMLQCRAWFQQKALDRVTFVCALPLYHIFSLTGELLAVRLARRHRPADRQPARLPGVRQGAARHPPMFFMGVNTLFNALMHTPGFERSTSRAWCATVAGGMALQSARGRRAGSSSPAALIARAGD